MNDDDDSDFEEEEEQEDDEPSKEEENPSEVVEEEEEIEEDYTAKDSVEHGSSIVTTTFSQNEKARKARKIDSSVVIKTFGKGELGKKVVSMYRGNVGDIQGLDHKGEFQACKKEEDCSKKAEEEVRKNRDDLNNFPYDYDYKCTKFTLDEPHYYIMKRRQKSSDKKGTRSSAVTPCDDQAIPTYLADNTPAWGNWQDTCLNTISLFGEATKNTCSRTLFYIGKKGLSQGYYSRDDKKEREEFCIGFFKKEDEAKEAIEHDIEMERKYQSDLWKTHRIHVQHKVMVENVKEKGITCSVNEKKMRDFPDGFEEFSFNPRSVTGNQGIFIATNPRKETSKVIKAPKYTMIDEIRKGTEYNNAAFSAIMIGLGFDSDSSSYRYGSMSFNKKIPYKSAKFKDLRPGKNPNSSPSLYCKVSIGRGQGDYRVLPMEGFQFLDIGGGNDLSGSRFYMFNENIVRPEISWEPKGYGSLKTVPSSVAKECNDLVSRALDGSRLNIKNYPKTAMSAQDFKKLREENLKGMDPLLAEAIEKFKK